MINGMVLQTQAPLGKMPNSLKSPEAMGEPGTGTFGEVLSMLTGNTSSMSDVIVETTEDLGEINELLTELLQLTDVDDLSEFLQENGFNQLNLPEIVDGHFIFHEEETLETLLQLMPELEEFIEISEDGVPLVDIRELLPIMEEQMKGFLVQGELENLLENFTQEEVVLFLSTMQIMSIEIPKLDLTVSQEHQLHSLQEVLKSIGLVFKDGSEENAQSKTPTLPFQDNHALTKLATITNSQSSHTFSIGTGMESAKVEGELQGNSRAEMLMRELENVFKRANFGQTGGTNRISIKLYPEHLGQLRIELLQTNGLLTARILASNALGKDMLESHLHQLRQAFLHQNIQVERIDISQMLNEAPQHERDRAFNQHFKQQEEPTSEQESESDEEEPRSFSEYIIELEG